MTPRTRRIVCLSAILGSAILGLLLLAFLHQRRLGDPLNPWLAIVVLGTLLGETSVASLWCALGPGSLAGRLPLAAVWLAMIVLAFGSNRSMNVGSPEIDPVSTTGVTVLVQWALIAWPLWLLADWRGERITYENSDKTTAKSVALPNNRQLGIRGTMLITAAVAAVLGGSTFRADRALIINWEAAREFGFLAVAGAALALPLGVQLLIFKKPWHTVIAIVPVVLFASTVDLMMALAAFGSRGIDSHLCWAIALLNFIQTTWLLVTLAILKLGGYGVVRAAAA